MDATEPTALVVAAAVADDDELANAARQLAWKSIEIAQYFLDHGSPQMKLRVVQSLMPAVAKALSARNDADESLAQLRADLTSLHQSMLH